MSEDTNTAQPSVDQAPPPTSAPAGTREDRIETYDNNIRQEAEKLQHERKEREARAPSPEKVAGAKRRLNELISEGGGKVAGDLETVEWRKSRIKEASETDGKLTQTFEPHDPGDKTALESARELAAYRKMKETALGEILSEQDQAATDEQAFAKANQEWEAQQADEARRQEATQAQERQAQVREQTSQWSQVEHQLAARLQMYQATATKEIPDILEIARVTERDPVRGQELWQDFVKRDPAAAAAKYNRFLQLDQAHRHDATQFQLASMQGQQQQRQAFHEWSAVEDRKFETSHPELADRRAKFEARENILEYALEKLGLDEAQLRAKWFSDPTLRSAAGQEAIYDAAMAHATKKNLVNATKRHNLPPVRPGTRDQDTGRFVAAAPDALRQIDAAPSTRLQIRRASELLASSRRAAKGGRR